MIDEKPHFRVRIVVCRFGVENIVSYDLIVLGSTIINVDVLQYHRHSSFSSKK